MPTKLINLKYLISSQNYFRKISKKIWVLAGFSALLVFFLSIYVNVGFYKATLEFYPHQLVSVTDNSIISYPFQDKTLLERSFLRLNPGGQATLSMDGVHLEKRFTLEMLKENPCGGFYIASEAIYLGQCVENLHGKIKNNTELKLQRPLKPYWPITGFSLFVVLLSIILWRFDCKKDNTFEFIYYLYFVFLFSAIFLSSLIAPGGSFINTIGDRVPMWGDNDPAAWYLTSAHELGRLPVIFPGHPGITLNILLWLIQKFIVFFSNNNLTFSQAVASNIFYVQVLSKTVCSLIFIGSSFIIAELGATLFKDRNIGKVASIFFSSSFFSVYFLNRISPDGLVILFFLLSFLFLVKALDGPTSPRVNLNIFFSCFFSVLAFYTKAQIMGILPVYVFLVFALLRWRYQTITSFCKDLISMFFGFGFIYFLMNNFMDWDSFLKLWNNIIAAKASSLILTNNIQNNQWLPILQLSNTFMAIMDKLSVINFLPLVDLNHLSFTFGGSACILFCISFLWRDIRKNSSYLLFCFYAALTLIFFCYRDFAFHYFLIFFSCASLSVAFVLTNLTRSISHESAFVKYLPSLLLIFLLNINGFLLAWDSHRQREIASKQSLDIYLALSTLLPGEKLISLDLASTVGLETGNLYNFGAPSKLIEAFYYWSN